MFGSGKRDQTPTTAFKAQRFFLKRARCGKIFQKKKNVDSMRQQLAESMFYQARVKQQNCNVYNGHAIIETTAFRDTK